MIFQRQFFFRFASWRSQTLLVCKRRVNSKPLANGKWYGALPAQGTDPPFHTRAQFQLGMSRMLFAAKQLFAAHEVSSWANEKEGKNTLNDNNNYSILYQHCSWIIKIIISLLIQFCQIFTNYSQTRSSVPVANKLMNSLMEK